MPLVSIAEILHPPVVGRITFSKAPSTLAIPVAPTAASDSFTSLLDSLDAVALTLQNAVDTKRISLKSKVFGTDSGPLS
jgi:hypothetical protein